MQKLEPDYGRSLKEEYREALLLMRKRIASDGALPDEAIPDETVSDETVPNEATESDSGSESDPEVETPEPVRVINQPPVYFRILTKCCNILSTVVEKTDFGDDLKGQIIALCDDLPSEIYQLLNNTSTVPIEYQIYRQAMIANPRRNLLSGTDTATTTQTS